MSEHEIYVAGKEAFQLGQGPFCPQHIADTRRGSSLIFIAGWLNAQEDKEKSK
jgi:hypothetical protein